MATIKKLGDNDNINACGLAVIFDGDGKAIARCMDTPNALAYAFSKLPSAEFCQLKLTKETKFRNEIDVKPFLGKTVAYFQNCYQLV